MKGTPGGVGALGQKECGLAPWAHHGEEPGPRGDPGAVWFGGPWFSTRGWGGRGGRPWGRAWRGDVRSAISALLAERPMHGYEIIGELAERTEGLWRASPGSDLPQPCNCSRMRAL